MKGYFFLLILLILPSTTAAHWIAGYVENALDGTSPNDRVVRLWNSSNSQEAFGVVGVAGASGTSNIYMIDCETFSIPCRIGDKLNLTIQADTSGYTVKKTTQVTVTGAGFDMAPNLSINTPPEFTSIIIEDSILSPENEIDLTPASTTIATCSGIVRDREGATSIKKVLAAFFYHSSTFESSDDNNTHYTNTTCEINTTYGTSEQAKITCSFSVEYYALSNSWQCQINTTDNYSGSTLSSDTTNINTLLAIGVDSPISFGEMELEEVSQEVSAEVTNYGNVRMNLTLSGYGQNMGDGNAMECGTKDIPIGYMKFNLTGSNSSNLTLEQFEKIYENLTSNSITHKFNLNSRQNDSANDAFSDTYWRVYLPSGISSNCVGNIIFGATQG